LELDQQNAEFIKTCLQNPVEFSDLMHDSNNLLEIYPKIKNDDQGELLRRFHTLKARFRQFGVKVVTKTINDVETEISKGTLNNIDPKVLCFERELHDFVENNRLIIEAAHKFMADKGQAIQASEVMKKIEKTESLDNLKLDIYQNYLLSDIKDKFERYRPLIEDLAKKQKKSIDLAFSGDKILIEYAKFSNFVNVTIHLFRNMVDHGIETEEERIEKTKSKRGHINVEFKHNGDSFYIHFTDDGRGINPEKIKSCVLEKGLKSEQELKDLKDSDCLNMIFLPGLSTKKEVTSISGRGVGMDAVRAAVESLGGTISVFSKVDVGTTFIIELPVLS
jgi:chemotaxis protein histidine kinase CheA